MRELRGRFTATVNYGALAMVSLNGYRLSYSLMLSVAVHTPVIADSF